MTDDDKVIDSSVALMEVPPQNVGIQMTPEFAAQLALAISKIHPLSLDGTNAFHHYDYPTVAQVRGNAGQALAQAGLGIVPEVVKWGRDARTTDKGKQTNVTFVQLRMHLFSEKGSLSVNWGGESEDLTDKGMAKAISAGVKSFLIAFLMMPFSEDENDDGTTDSELAKKRAKAKQPDDIVAIVEEARKLGVTFKVEGDSLRPLHGDKMTKELNAKVLKNSAAIVEYIKANAAPTVQPAPEANTKEVKTDPKAEKGTTGDGGTQTTTQATSTKTNGDAPKRPLAPDKLKEFIGKKAESFSGKKCNDSDRNQLAAAMQVAFTDRDAKDREAKRHRVCKFLTGYGSLSAKSENKMPDWYVLAIKAWLSFSYKDGKYLLPKFVIEEANACEHEALMQEGGLPPLSPVADFEAECLTTGHTAEEIKAWLGSEVGWAISEWDKCEPAIRELIAIACTQKLDLLKDESMRQMAIVKAMELWPN